jgi:hypothetical protein
MTFGVAIVSWIALRSGLPLPASTSEPRKLSRIGNSSCVVLWFFGLVSLLNLSQNIILALHIAH